jgi:hypothetical protein
MANSYTTTYSLTKPEVGAAEDQWGDLLNTNFDAIDDILDGTTPVTGIDINGGTIDGVTIGATSAPTVTNLGSVATADINGGTIDGTVIGGTTPAAITGTTLTATSSATLQHSASTKLATTSTGIDVTGTVTADGLTVDGAAVISGTSDAQSYLRIQGQSGNAADVNFAGIEFYNTDPSAKGPNVAAFIEARAVDTIGQAGQLVFATAPTGSTPEGERATQRMRISDGGDISFYEDTGTTAKFFWDASAEALGIGTSSPSTGIHLSGVGQTIRIEDTDTTLLTDQTIGKVDFYSNDASGAGAGVKASVTALAEDSIGRTSLVFSTANDTANDTERLRLDSSGNLLVGTTSTAISNVGAVIFPGGVMTITNDGGRPLRLNRKTSDGAILDFDKDGTTVGSISSYLGAYLVAGSSGNNNDTYLAFANGTIKPATSTGDNRDNTTNLGQSNSRFKDLYLSGGVYLGGTGAANLLDDYEEGNHITTASVSSGSYVLGTGYDTLAYTKIGRLVTITGQIGNASVSAATGPSVSFTLPFVVGNYLDTSGRGGGAVAVENTSGGSSGLYSFGYTENGSGVTVYIDMTTVNTGTDFKFSFSYFTDA